MKIAVVCPRRDLACGVFDHSKKLVRHLGEGHEVVFITNPFPGNGVSRSRTGTAEDHRILHLNGWGFRGFARFLKYIGSQKPDVVNIQYTPYLYHRYGVNLFLPLAAFLLRLSGTKIVLTIHERYVPLTHWKLWIVGWPQRLILAAMVVSSRIVFVSVRQWAERLRRLFWFKKNRIFWTSSPSNIDDLHLSEHQRGAIRERLGVRPEGIVISVFHPLGTGKMPGELLDIWERVRSKERKCKLVVIGHTADEFSRRKLDPFHPEDVYFSGYASEEEVGQLLSATDVFLAPYQEGISSKHSSAMAAMSYGLPVITTRGSLTDPFFDRSPVIMTSADPERMSETVLKYVRDGGLRNRTGREIKVFFETYFSWSRVTHDYLTEMTREHASCVR